MPETTPPPRPTAAVSKGSKCAFRTYHKTIKEDGSPPKSEEVSEPFGPNIDKKGDDEFAIVIRRSFKKDVCKTRIRINSLHIIEALRDAVQPHNPTAAADLAAPLTLKAPFEMLAHYWDELEALRKSAAPNTSYAKHLGLLFQFMEHEVKPTREAAQAMIKKGQIGFKNAWTIYRPGDILYKEMLGEPWLLLCKKTVYEEDPCGGPYMEVHAVYTDNNGEIVGDATLVLQIWQREKFPAEGPVAITELPIYPRRYVPLGDALERRLKIRGEKFLQLRNCVTVKYDGTAEWLRKPPHDYYDPSDGKFRGVWLPYTENGRVVLDRKTFGEDEMMSHVSIKLAKPKPWLCPPFTVGYSLSRKHWVHLLVDNISDAGWTPNTWDALVLAEEQKSLLRSLITSHRYSKNPRDRNQLKGQGLVILLHGAPGSGKTLTAEVAAEASQKALVSTSMGELNRSPSAMFGAKLFEAELRKVLQYATIWQAIVLFDEADVFLQARGENSADQNALVAIFLKELEYFGGIVFLTTNRVKTFDTAMKSRINFTLEYVHPNANIRRQIWQRCLKAIPQGQSAISVDEVVGKLATTEINGREIANAVNTARTLARHENRPLTMKHLETLLKARDSFGDSLDAE